MSWFAIISISLLFLVAVVYFLGMLWIEDRENEAAAWRDEPDPAPGEDRQAVFYDWEDEDDYARFYPERKVDE